MVHDRILERGAALRALINAGKAWLNAYHECVAVAAGLPGKEGLTATWEGDAALRGRCGSDSSDGSVQL